MVSTSRNDSSQICAGFNELTTCLGLLPDPLLDSACMEPKDWVLMANDIEENYYAYDGFVVIMGTDTMAYAASALVNEKKTRDSFVASSCHVMPNLSLVQTVLHARELGEDSYFHRQPDPVRRSVQRCAAKSHRAYYLRRHGRLPRSVHIFYRPFVAAKNRKNT